jgi:hypothetical protein
MLTLSRFVTVATEKERSMKTIVPDVEVPALPPQGRVVNEIEFQSLLKQLRLARACLNNIEAFLENVYINGLAVPAATEGKIIT